MLWEALSVSLAALAVVGAAILGLWVSSTNSIRENYGHYLIGLAQTAATLVDPALHQAIRRPGQRNGPDYTRVVQPLRRMRSALPEVHFIYTAVRDGEQLRFVLDAAEPGDQNHDGLDDQAGVWEVYEERDPAMMQALGDAAGGHGVAAATDQPYVDKWGAFMTGWAPILDAAGRQVAVVGVDVDASVYVARLGAARHGALLGLAPAGILIALLGSAFYAIRMRALAIEAALRDSESNFRSLFQFSPLGISLSDLHTGEILQANESLLATTGYRREELLRLSSWDMTPGAYVASEQDDRQSLAVADRFGPLEKQYTRKDGSAYPVLVSGIRMRDTSGRAVLWSMIQDISLRKVMELELIAAAQQDKLTGLANRALFKERLQWAIERVRAGTQPMLAVLFLDFDRFKLVNDTLGHKAGDELLRQIAVRLRNALRTGDVIDADERGNLVGRFGGDEFTILFNDLKEAGHAIRIAERLLNILTPVYSIFGSEVHSTASIGIVTSDQCQSSADDVVRNADVAMFEAKRAGRGCAVLFNEAMHARLTRHVTIEANLRRAIGTDQLSLVYQPIIELGSGRLVSAEALVRWHHPTLGNITPSEFIPIAEESGLIVPLGQWVLKEACRTMVAWCRQDPQRSPATVSVNVSRAELALGSRLLEQLTSTLASVGLPAQSLQLEVTEREVMRNPEASLKLMHELRGLGVRLAMDDFGTGTSSLGFLRDYPFDTIKIDRSFVQDLTSNTDVLAVIHATVNLIENLGMASLAEGVEEPAQVAILQSLGCRYAQGYLFSRPVAADRLLDALPARERAPLVAAAG